MLLCIIFYDIARDKTRTKLSKKLIYHGFSRLQFSIFAGTIDQKRFDQLWQELKENLVEDNNAEDKLYVLFIGANQFRKMKCYGPEPDKEFIIGTLSSLLI